VPLGRLVTARDALFAAYLASTTVADHFVGQVFRVCGGWVTR
jgi:2-keto-3-deoxy-L-fuconate dehydrogenase